MECWCRLSIQLWWPVSTKLTLAYTLLYYRLFYKTWLRISYYATASSKESVYVIGGNTAEGPHYSTTIIAEYKNDEWYNVGNLKQSRYAHSAITSGPLTMIIGGNQQNSAELWVKILKTVVIYEFVTLDYRLKYGKLKHTRIKSVLPNYQMVNFAMGACFSSIKITAKRIDF